VPKSARASDAIVTSGCRSIVLSAERQPSKHGEQRGRKISLKACGPALSAFSRWLRAAEWPQVVGRGERGAAH
jgi:hypothetical protein